MPVMLLPNGRRGDPEMTIDDLRAMLRPYDPALMTEYEVSRAVNSVKNDTSECVEPLSNSPESTGCASHLVLQQAKFLSGRFNLGQ